MPATALPRECNTEQVFDDDLNAYLQYKIVCTPDPFRKESIAEKVYSILIVKVEELDEVETRFFYDVSRSLEKASRIIDSLSNNSVTPCSAEDILPELI